MKGKNITLLFLLFYLSSCNNNDDTATEASANNVDVARNFIRSALDGKYDDAKNYMITDSANLTYIEVAKRNYERGSQEMKNGYRASSIRIHTVRDVNDSLAFVIYSNSYKNDHDTLKVLKTGSRWLVDLKYLFQPDSSFIK
jgi:hypothetical protein